LVLGRPIQTFEAEECSKLGAEIMELPSKDGIIDLRSLFHRLGKRQITSVLVEGGGILVGSLFDQGLVDKVLAFIAPIIIGGEGRSAVAGHGIDKLLDAHRLEHVKITRFGPDVLISGYATQPNI
jgi:diaminohydroxyphosphoribosylaminopyrimidine deaminase/5-amino-6-(5-phosphoribosylamino)uracil reductase